MDSSLEEIELEVLTLHNAINVRATVERAKRIGELLLVAKARLPHGAYLPWLKKLGLNRKTAHDYTVIAKAPNVRQTGHLGIGAVLTLLRAGRRADRQEQADELAEGVLPTQERKIVTADSWEWMAEQKPDSFPFIISDPPYGLGLTYDDWAESDTSEGYWRWMEPFWEEMQRILMPGGSILLWQSYKRFAHLGEWFPNARIVADCQNDARSYFLGADHLLAEARPSPGATPRADRLVRRPTRRQGPRPLRAAAPLREVRRGMPRSGEAVHAAGVARPRPVRWHRCDLSWSVT